MEKPKLTLGQIFNMSAGFFGIQFGFALQNGNASRILQTYGADVEHLSLFWLAAPITGMLVQPIIGHYSDKTWNKFGRRRPYFLVGAILTSIALFLMPNAGSLTSLASPVMVGAGMLMLMDASINVAMEPFRALVGDKLPDSQRNIGFSVQTFLIGVGAISGSLLPYILSEYVGISKIANQGEIPLNIVYSFYAGALILLFTILYTVFTTTEYPPNSYNQQKSDDSLNKNNKGIKNIIHDFVKMPPVMKSLGLVQFFSWFALFSMWVFTSPAIAQHVYKLNLNDTSSATFADAGNWVGILFGVYNGVSAIYALLLPSIANKFGRKATHAISLTIGGLGLISIYFITNPNLLIIPMIGVGMAWGSILSMPYAILAGAVPSEKMGVYMGIFNFFITMPQIINGFIGGVLVKHFYNGETIFALVLAGIFMLLGAVSVLKINDKYQTS